MQSSTTKSVDEALKSFAKDGQLSIRISGDCMTPLIKDGAMIDVLKQGYYWPGDILVKRCMSGQLISHRLIGCYPHKGQLNFVTRADNATRADAAIASSQIIGRVSGGECAEAAFVIPTWYRFKALRQFTFLVIQRVGIRVQRTWVNF